jgi:pimeloyl-ACP methyl ester carboxylesterase
VAIIAVFFYQRRLLYFPDKTSLDAALSRAKLAGFEPWENNGQLIGWKLSSKAPGSHHRVLITHGNAGSAIDRVDYARGVNQAGDWDVYLLEYPGYGPRPGKPSQNSFFAAGDEALSLLEKDGPVFVIGESLGTGVAAYLAGAHPKAIAGLLLAAPYENLGDVAQDHMRIFPARWMLLDRFTSGTYLRNFHGRLAVLLAADDTVVPSSHGRKLFDGYRGGPKKLWIVPHAGHNDLPNEPPEWWLELLAFWKSE